MLGLSSKAQAQAPGRLVNLSVRAQVGTGANILIPGFVVSGSGTETLLIRADGPALTQFGVTGILAQPSLSVIDNTGSVIASNTGWSSNANSSQIATAAAAVGAFALQPGSADCAVLVSLPAGAYTVQISGINNVTGIALAEIYELSSTGTSLINISARAQVGTGASVVIPGFVISGATSKQLLIRADGPSLAQFAVPNVLVNPVLTLFEGSIAALQNDKWGDQLASVFRAAGAFAFTPGSADAAFRITLPPGSYTAEIAGANNTTGTGLIELYDITPQTPDAQQPVGAAVPWVHYEAEDGVLGGSAHVLGPNRNVGDPAGEASGRECVNLQSTGDSVQWTVTAPASALVVRISIPDAPTGGGINATLGVYKGNVRIQDIPVTSHYSWLYGPETAPVNDPSAGPPRRIYDESHVLLSAPFARGDVIRLQKDAQDTAKYYNVDFIELENPVPLPQPANSISIVSAGADPTGVNDSAAAVDAAIAQAQASGKIVWMPPGEYAMSRQITAQGVTIQGAGMWFTELWAYNSAAIDTGNNVTGFWVAGDNTIFSDFRIRGEGTMRNTGGYPFLGPFGENSQLVNIWTEHTDVGAWIGVQGGPYANGLLVEGCRFRDTYADGIDLDDGTTNSVIKNCTARNVGDDAFSVWSYSGASRPGSGNTISHCTAQCIWRAAGLAAYGGGGNTFEYNLVEDTLVYPGITVADDFAPYPFAGITNFNFNSLLRCGGAFFGGIQFGAIWVHAGYATIAAPINFVGNSVADSTFSALSFTSGDVGGAYQITGPVLFDDLTINMAPLFIQDIDNTTSGTVTIGSAILNQVANPGIASDGSTLVVIRQ